MGGSSLTQNWHPTLVAGGIFFVTLCLSPKWEEVFYNEHKAQLGGIEKLSLSTCFSSHLLDAWFWGAFYRVPQKVLSGIETPLSTVINSSIPTLTEFLCFTFPSLLLPAPPPHQPRTSKINYLWTRLSVSGTVSGWGREKTMTEGPKESM